MILILTLVLCLIAISRSSPRSATFLYALYIIFSAFFLQYILSDLVQGSRLLRVDKAGILAGSDGAQLMYAGAAAMVLVATLIPRLRSSWRINLNNQLLSGTMPAIAAVLLSVMCIVHAVSIDWGLLYHNRWYLDFNSAKTLGATFGPAIIFHSALSFIFLAAALSLCLLQIRRTPVTFTLLLICCLYMYVIFLASHSRWAGAVVLACAGALALKGRGNAPLAVVLFVIGITSYAHAIVGRNSGEHGISTIATTLSVRDLSLLADYVFVTFYTFFEGITVTARALNIPTAYSAIYTNLSFSPLPGGVDGFAAIRQINEVRVTANVPFGGWVEAYRFGPLYFGFWSVFIVLLLWLNRSFVAIAPNALAIASSAITLTFIVFSHAYPVRNTFRYLLALFIAYLVVLIIGRTSRARGRARAARFRGVGRVPTRRGHGSPFQ